MARCFFAAALNPTCVYLTDMHARDLWTRIVTGVFRGIKTVAVQERLDAYAPTKAGRLSGRRVWEHNSEGPGGEDTRRLCGENQGASTEGAGGCNGVPNVRATSRGEPLACPHQVQARTNGGNAKRLGGDRPALKGRNRNRKSLTASTFRLEFDRIDLTGAGPCAIGTRWQGFAGKGQGGKEDTRCSRCWGVGRQCSTGRAA
eukprot:911083-Prorocentrum_minimum.AAC.6